jgi:glycosyltransferase involved in cell wall biosynthesis
MNPLVTVVIPSYNHEKFITTAVDSCLSQTYRDLEIVVVDDGSQDNSVELLRMRYAGDRRSPIRSYLKWSLRLAFQEYRYCREKGYLSHLLLIPLHEALRVFAYHRGLRKGLALYRRPGKPAPRKGRLKVGPKVTVCIPTWNGERFTNAPSPCITA